MNLSERCKFVLETLEEVFSVRVHPASRLGAKFRVLVDDDGNPKPEIESGSREHEVARAALLEVLPLDLALRVLKPDDLNCKPLQQLVKGEVLPQNDKSYTPGRDLQSELYVASVLSCAGVFKGFDEPDIKGVVNDLLFGVAVKRVKSIGSLEGNIRSAGDQILLSECTGIIALDVSVLLNPHSQPINRIMPDSEFDARSRDAMMIFINQRKKQFMKWVQAKRVHGIMFVCHLVRLRAPQNWGMESIHVWLNTTEINQRRSREAEMINVAYRKGAKLIERY